MTVTAGRWSVVVRPDSEEFTSSGIFIPDISGRDDAQLGTVVAVGAGRHTEVGAAPLPLVAGDTVLFTRYAGESWVYEGEDLLILHESHVLAKVDHG